MPSRSQVVTAAPTALAGVPLGAACDVQNLGTTPVALAFSVGAPDPASLAFSVQPLDRMRPTPAAGESIWVWVPNSTEAAVAVAYAETP